MPDSTSKYTVDDLLALLEESPTARANPTEHSILKPVSMNLSTKKPKVEKPLVEKERVIDLSE